MSCSMTLHGGRGVRTLDLSLRRPTHITEPTVLPTRICSQYDLCQSILNFQIDLLLLILEF